MSQRQRLLAALGVAVVVACYIRVSPIVFPAYESDFDQLWLAARWWRQGLDPYAAYQANRANVGIGYGLLYPFPAALVAWPLSFLPIEWARVVWATAGSGVFAWVVLAPERARTHWPILLSGSFRAAVSLGQAGPFTASAVVLPWLGWIAAVKPHTGIAAMCALRSRRQVLIYLSSAVTLGAVAVLLFPAWPGHWLDAIQHQRHIRPLVLTPGGLLLLLALLRWRLPEARWLVAMALVPGNRSLADSLPLLLLLPRTRLEALLFATLSGAVEIAASAARDGSPLRAYGHTAMFQLWGFYMPALLLVLRRTNEADA